MHRNLVELLLERVDLKQGTFAYRFITPTGYQDYSFAELHQSACALAALLQFYQLENQPVIILLPPGLDYITAFFACLYAKVLAVPCYPPRNNQQNDRLLSIITNAGAKYIITHSNLRHCNFSNGHVLYLDQLTTNPADYKSSNIAPDQIAFLQYTSGSTQAPKGVIVTHANLLANFAAMQERLKMQSDQIGCSWLPPYHDLGLIGGILYPMYANFAAVLFSPHYFLQQPRSWLQLISTYRARISPAPNFAYEYCCNKLLGHEVASLDLSCWEIALNGAETVHPGTLRNFFNKFKRIGFKYEAFYPAYGLAESTLFVTGRNPLTPITTHVKGAIEYTSCGITAVMHDVKIVNPSTCQLLPPGEEGEIWIAGPSVAQGYWQTQDQAFGHNLSQMTGRNYLRTGDQGFLNDAQELFITGRIKEMIVLRGKNYFPQDIERIAYESSPQLINHAAAAFQLAGNDLSFLIILEIKRHTRDYTTIYQHILSALYDHFEIKPAKIVLIQQASLPRTSSGKIQRLKTRELFLDNNLKIIDVWQKKSATPYNQLNLRERNDYEYSWLVNWLAIKLKTTVSKLTPSTQLNSLGLDSIIIGELIADLFDQFHLNAILDKIYTSQTIGELHHYLEQQKPQEYAEVPFEATPSEQEFSILQTMNVSQPRFSNIPLTLEIKGNLNIAIMEETLQFMFTRHEIFHITYEHTTSGWRKSFTKKISFHIKKYDFTMKSLQESHVEIEKLVSELELFNFPLTKPPLMEITIFQVSKKHYYVNFVFSHLIADGWSVYYFMSEYCSIYNAKVKKKTFDLPLAFPYSLFTKRQLSQTHQSDALYAYWKKRTNPLLLLSDIQYPIHDHYQCHTIRQLLPINLYHKMVNFAKSEKLTFYTLFYAAFILWLNKYEHQPVIHFKALHANRQHAADYHTMGFLADKILAVEVLSNQRDEFLKTCQKNIQNDLLHAQLSMEKILATLPNKLSRMLPRYALSFNNYLKMIKLEGCKLRIATEFSKDDLMWGDTVTTALHIYQLENNILLRLRNLRSKEENSEALSLKMQSYLECLKQIVYHKI